MDTFKEICYERNARLAGRKLYEEEISFLKEQCEELDLEEVESLVSHSKHHMVEYGRYPVIARRWRETMEVFQSVLKEKRNKAIITLSIGDRNQSIYNFAR